MVEDKMKLAHQQVVFSVMVFIEHMTVIDLKVGLPF